MRASTSPAWWLLAILCLGVAGYALAYVVLGARMYPPPLADSFLARPWGIYPHAFFGMLALGLAPFQFLRVTLIRRRWLHRLTGRSYMVAALLTGVAGLYMSWHSFGGMVTHLGFGGMAVALLGCTTIAWLKIRRREIAAHREWVIRSFALLFSAVTLRLWLPLLEAGLGGFEPAYLWVSWVSWLPNLLVAELYLRRTRNADTLQFLHAARPG
jgi:hypothetical protein